jgi:hypothetical protein
MDQTLASADGQILSLTGSGDEMTPGDTAGSSLAITV